MDANKQPEKDTKKRKRKRRKKVVRAKPRGIGSFFLRGLVTLLPAFLTLIIFGLLFQMVDRYITGPINDFIYWSLERNSLGWDALDELGIHPLDADYLDEALLSAELRELVDERGHNDATVLEMIQNERDQYLMFFRDLEKLAVNTDKLRIDVVRVVHPGYGILLSILIVLWLCWLMGGFFGRLLVGRLDRMMHMIPVVKSIYPYSKQLVEFFFAEKKFAFDTVVAIRYPSPGIWSIAFVTGNCLRTVREDTELELITCFVPSSPMPMTGYTVFTSPDHVIPLPLSVDEALRITMTGGVLVPPHELVREAAEHGGQTEYPWGPQGESHEDATPDPTPAEDEGESKEKPS